MSYNSGNCSPPTSMPAASWLHQPKAQTPSGRRGTHLAGRQELWIAVTPPHVGTVTIKLEQRQKWLSLKCFWREAGLVSQGGRGMVLRERGCEGCRSRHPGTQDASGPCSVLWPLEPQVRTISLTEDKDRPCLLLLALCLLTQQAALPVPELLVPASIQMTKAKAGIPRAG